MIKLHVFTIDSWNVNITFPILFLEWESFSNGYIVIVWMGNKSNVFKMSFFFFYE